MQSKEEKVIKDDDTMVEFSGELEDKIVKDVEVPQKVTLMPRPPPPFPQRSVKKTEDVKYRFYNDAETTFYQCPFGRSS